ncbi:hypothetical protein HHI36_007664, partial [Cryptolaemus montrouzieri]
QSSRTRDAELGRLFRTYCSEQHSKWAYQVPHLVDILNGITHESIGFSPNELQLGTNKLRLLPDRFRGSGSEIEDISCEEKLILADATLQSRAARRAFRNPGG